MHDPGEQREVDARDQQLRDREADRVDQVGAGAEPPEHELRHRADLRAVVERHHHDTEEQHRRDGADPEVVERRQADLRAVGRHAHDLDGTEVGGDERQTGHPGRQRAAGEEEVDRVRDRSTRHHADAEDETEVDRDQQVVQPGRVDQGVGAHGCLPRISGDSVGPRSNLDPHHGRARPPLGWGRASRPPFRRPGPRCHPRGRRGDRHGRTETSHRRRCRTAFDTRRLADRLAQRGAGDDV